MSRMSSPIHLGGAPKPSDSSGALEEKNRKTAAETSNDRFVTALLRYGAKHGLPRMSADECREKLWGLKSKPPRAPVEQRPLGYRRTKEDSWTVAQHEAAMALRRNGLSYGKIGREIGRSYDAVAARLRDYGQA